MISKFMCLCGAAASWIGKGIEYCLELICYDGFFRELRMGNGVLIIEHHINTRGSFLQLSEFRNGKRKGLLVIPEGLKCSGRGTSTPSQLGSSDAGIIVHTDFQSDCPQSPVAIGVSTCFQGSLSIEDGGSSRILSTLEEADKLLSEDENGVTEGSAPSTCSLPHEGVVESDKVAHKGLSRGPTSNVLIDGTTTPMLEVKETLMVTTTMDSNNIAVQEVRNLNAGYCGEEISGLSLVPCEEERPGSGEQLGIVFGDNVIPLVSLPPTNNIASSPSN
ncbi:uncharacterized protein LOC118344192 [Juglans regia]|uniref:Uncharacterized protein LOC118344192 n=1 Tax=Juglans regia TaxID=51240 RepID=A0A6P9DYG9_JUGRE|nr:uncharacterized protein LOC118344192 [Juglans regia]